MTIKISRAKWEDLKSLLKDRAKEEFNLASKRDAIGTFHHELNVSNGIIKAAVIKMDLMEKPEVK
jgi:hypothetical protein